MCGATDCPSCGPAQGYTVVRRYVKGRYVFVNPEDDEDHADADEFFDDEPDEDAADAAADRWERDRDARQP
jgi:hypothetical protein